MSLMDLLEKVSLDAKEFAEKGQVIRDASGLGKDFEQEMVELAEKYPDHICLVTSLSHSLFEKLPYGEFCYNLRTVVDIMPESVARALVRYVKGMAMTQVYQLERQVEEKFAAKRPETKEDKPDVS